MSDEPTKSRSCKGITGSGNPCRGYSVPPSDFCNFHDPDFNFKEGTTKGGQNTRKWFNKDQHAGDPRAIKAFGGSPSLKDSVMDPLAEDIVLETPADVRRFLAQAMNEVRAGRLDVGRAQNITYMATALLTAMKTERPEKGGAEDELMPEITEIARSDDERATADEHPGSEMGAEPKAN